MRVATKPEFWNVIFIERSQPVGLQLQHQLSHEIIVAEIIQRLTVRIHVDPSEETRWDLDNSFLENEKSTHFDEAFTPVRAGLAEGFAFFLPLPFSLCSRCFSFAKVVSPLAAFRTSTSLKGAANALTCISTNIAYRGLS